MDKRKNNGGHSTKATKPDDKRRNQGRALLDRYIREGFDYDKLEKLFDKLLLDAMTKGDTKSASLLLSYVLGRPKESKDITTNGESINQVALFTIPDNGRSEDN
jgi:hypothetical protein